MKIQSAIAALSLVAATSVLAHPGHGTTESSTIVHYLSEPLHIALGAAAVLAIVAIGVVLKRANAKKPAAQKQEIRSR